MLNVTWKDFENPRYGIVKKCVAEYSFKSLHKEKRFEGISPKSELVALENLLAKLQKEYEIKRKTESLSALSDRLSPGFKTSPEYFRGIKDLVLEGIIVVEDKIRRLKKKDINEETPAN